jgi:hypothetical protein
MAARSTRHMPGDLVQLTFGEGDLILRGIVVATAKTEKGTGLRLLSVPGYDGHLVRVPTRRLSPADPFRPVPVPSLNLTATTPTKAQQLLVALALTVRNDELIREPSDEAVLQDREHLAEALGKWAGSGLERVLASAEAAAHDATDEDRLLSPARLAAESFLFAFDSAPALDPDIRQDRGKSSRSRSQPRKRQ